MQSWSQQFDVVMLDEDEMETEAQLWLDINDFLGPAAYKRDEAQVEDTINFIQSNPQLFAVVNTPEWAKDNEEFNFRYKKWMRCPIVWESVIRPLFLMNVNFFQYLSRTIRIPDSDNIKSKVQNQKMTGAVLCKKMREDVLKPGDTYYYSWVAHTTTELQKFFAKLEKEHPEFAGWGVTSAVAPSARIDYRYEQYAIEYVKSLGE